jgi:lysine-N-methylase
VGVVVARASSSRVARVGRRAVVSGRGALPARPRLADHVVARRHVVAGQEMIVLRDLASGASARIGPREWTLLLAADGTRDLAGVILAAAREGVHATEGALAAFLSDLAREGLLEDDVADAPPSRPTLEVLGVPRDRPLDPLPGYRFACDGRGGCCGFYGTVVFSPLEALRARALAPAVRDGGERPERAFVPERGVAAPGLAVTSVDGRCAYLERDGRCAVHAAGGLEAKPLGCRTFPARFVDDGEVVRVTAAVECACVVRSRGSAEGASLLPHGARVAGDLDPALHVESLAEGFAAGPSVAASRAELCAWSRDLVAAEPPRNAVAATWALAADVERHGLGRRGGPTRFPGDAPPPAPGEVIPLLEHLAAAAARRALEDATWGGESLLAGRAVRFIHAAATALLEPELCALVLAAPGRYASAEAFYLRAVLHGHELVGALTIADALRDRAVRMLVARALPIGFAALDEDGSDPALEHPIAIVEATLRGHGLATYFPGT